MARARTRVRSSYETSQPDKRRFNRWRDQHGRVWEGVMDINSGQPIGPLSIVGGEPPLMPEQKYFKFQYLDNAFIIDYGRWIRDMEKARATFERRRRRYARKLYGEKAGQMLRDNPAELQHEVGTEPDPIEPVLAAASGNKWVLGLSDNKPSWADRYFPDDKTALTNPRRGLTPEYLSDLRERFPDADADEDIGDVDPFNLDSLSPEQKQWLAEMQEEEAALEEAGELE